MLRRNELRGLFALALAGLFAGAACSGDEVGPPRVGCPSGACGPAPICGEACKSACGCCPCVDGAIDERGGVTLVCSAGCFTMGAPIDAGTGGTGGSAGAAGAAGTSGSAGIAGTAGTGGCTGCVSGLFVCGQCNEPCGCCPCTLGEVQIINGIQHTCDGTCFNPG